MVKNPPSLIAGRRISPYGLRIPEELKEDLVLFANHYGRSLHAEILYRLRESVKQEMEARGEENS